MVETNEKTINQGLNVRLRRTSKMMSQSDLSDLMNISAQKLSNIEKKTVIDDETLNLIAEKLDTDVNWFKTFDPNGLEGYGSTNITNTFSPNDSPQTVAPTDSAQVQEQFGSNTIIKNPIKELMELTQIAVAKIEEHHKKEIEMKEKIFALQLENALLKQKNELTGNSNR